jgi:hypothetical protein
MIEKKTEENTVHFLKQTTSKDVIEKKTTPTRVNFSNS